MPAIVRNIPIPPRFVQFATAWHDGQSSMLYAIASTGGLTRGTIRPYGIPPQDGWWDYKLWSDLRHELYVTQKGFTNGWGNGQKDYDTCKDFLEFVDAICAALEPEGNELA